MIVAENVSFTNISDRVAELKSQGYRFVTITCVRVEGGQAELLYHFDRHLGLVHLRLSAEGSGMLPSISAIFPAAYLVENEIQDHFGLHFSGLVPDYRRTLFLEGEGEAAPFCRDQLAKKEQ